MKTSKDIMNFDEVRILVKNGRQTVVQIKPSNYGWMKKKYGVLPPKNPSAAAKVKPIICPWETIANATKDGVCVAVTPDRVAACLEAGADRTHLYVYVDAYFNWYHKVIVHADIVTAEEYLTMADLYDKAYKDALEEKMRFLYGEEA